MKYIFAGISLLFASFSSQLEAKTVHYDLVATQGDINLSGKKTVDFALMINGGIPAPTLEFTEGDDAEIVVRNNIPNQELSIHWHGILLPPEMDGVPYVTTPTILSGKSLTFKFKIRQHGTFWYHSHTNIQEQKGIYGAFIIHPKNEVKNYRDVVAVISDWSDENASQILANLRKDGDYYLYKKGTMRSWAGAAKADALSTYLHNEWTRMGGMDLSDVGYDAFLINGKKELQLVDAKPGEIIRIRLINAAASSYFYVGLGENPMNVISADGVDITPTKTKEILMGMAETYDVLFEVPEKKQYELRVTAQDGTGHATGWIGTGSEKVSAPVKAMPDAYAPMDHGAGHGEHKESGSPDSQMGGMDHSAHTDVTNKSDKKDSVSESNEHMHHNKSKEGPEHNHGEMNHGAHEQMHHGGSHDSGTQLNDNAPMQELTVDGIKAKDVTQFSGDLPVTDLKLVLGGDMERYIWHVNGKAIHQDRTIEIREGEVIRFTFVNETMMHHPMHLHGHFFRVLNQFGPNSPLKHTVDVPPHATRTIEFFANEPGEWMLHCHNLYHMKNGMARVVKYMSYTPTPEMKMMQQHDPHLHDHIYTYGRLEASSNHASGLLRLSQTWDVIELEVEGANIEGNNFSYKKGEWEVEGDLFYRRWFDNYFNLILGGTSFGYEETAVAGVGYLLPFLIETNLLLTHKGKFRLDLEKKFQWTETLFSDVEATWRPNQDGAHALEYEISLMYANSWSWAAGFMATNDSVGGGAQFQF